MEDYIYNNIIKNIALSFELELQRMSAIYNFDLGDEFELSICHLLGKILPKKYGICRGFVVNSKGDTAGDDIIIYDQESFPVLRFLDEKNCFACKQQIPVEAVYAYIEAKHTLDEQTFLKAFQQVINVKKICYTRDIHIRSNSDIGKKVFDKEYAQEHGGDPIIKNPVYTMILSRHCRVNSSTSENEMKKVQKFIIDTISKSLHEKIEENGFYCPDSIVSTANVFAVCGHYLLDELQRPTGEILITKFYTGIKHLGCYQVNIHQDQSYGLALAHLMLALNFIKLKNFPWDRVFNTAKMPDRIERQRLLSK